MQKLLAGLVLGILFSSLPLETVSAAPSESSSRSTRLERLKARKLKRSNSATIYERRKAAQKEKKNYQKPPKIYQPAEKTVPVITVHEYQYSSLEIAGFIAKTKSNIAVIEDAIEAYGTSPSHSSLVDQMRTLLFNLKGLTAQMEVLGRYSEGRDLADEENTEVGRLMSEINDAIKQYNQLLPSR